VGCERQQRGENDFPIQNGQDLAPPGTAENGAAIVRGLRRAPGKSRAGRGAACGQCDGKEKNRAETAERRVDEPERNCREQDGAACLYAAIISRRFAAPLRRRAERQQRITAGAQTGPAETAQRVGKHGGLGERNKAEKHRAG